MTRVVTSCRIAAFVFNIVGYACLIVAFATDYWFEHKGVDDSFSEGLWKQCLPAKLGVRKRCIKLPGLLLVSSVKATRGLMSIALAFITAGFFSYIAWMAKKKPNRALSKLKKGAKALAKRNRFGEKVLDFGKKMKSCSKCCRKRGSPKPSKDGTPKEAKTAMALSIVGAIFNAIGLLVYGLHHKDDEGALSWSFILAAVSAGVVFFNSAISLCVVRKHSDIPRSESTESVAGEDQITELFDAVDTGQGQGQGQGSVAVPGGVQNVLVDPSLESCQVVPSPIAVPRSYQREKSARVVVTCRGATFAFNTAGYICLIVAFATDNWLQENDVFRQGLWKYCILTSVSRECATLTEMLLVTEVKVTRALLSVALTFTTAAFGTYIAWMVRKNDDLKENGTPNVARAAMALSTVGALVIAAACVVYFIYTNNNDFLEHLSWSFILAAVSAVVVFFNSTISLCVVGNHKGIPRSGSPLDDTIIGQSTESSDAITGKGRATAVAIVGQSTESFDGIGGLDTGGIQNMNAVPPGESPQMAPPPAAVPQSYQPPPRFGELPQVPQPQPSGMTADMVSGSSNAKPPPIGIEDPEPDYGPEDDPTESQTEQNPSVQLPRPQFKLKQPPTIEQMFPAPMPSQPPTTGQYFLPRPQFGQDTVPPPPLSYQHIQSRGDVLY